MSSTTPAPLVTHAMILAAGRGERMRPLTDHTPKSMLPVKGKPLIQWHLESLAKAGIQHVVINLAHLGEQIAQHVHDGRALGLQVRYSREPEGALETAGGIALAKPWVNEQGELSHAPFVVINGDVFTDWPAHQVHVMARQMQKHHALAHLLLVDNPMHHPKGDFVLGDRLDSGNESTAWVRGAASQPGSKNPLGPSLTFSGVGVYDSTMFKHITPGDRQALAPLLFALADQHRCLGTHYTGLWTDVGTPERLASLQ